MTPPAADFPVRSWLEGGKRASEGPDKDTDTLLPAGDKAYLVNARRGDHCRHLTIEKNAAIVAGHAGGPFTAWGNVWVRNGGRVHFIDIVGPGHTFFRLDGGEFVRLGTEGSANSGVSGLYMAEGSTLRVHTKDAAKARLVVTAVMHAGEPKASGGGQGLDLQFGGDVALKGVLFDYVRVGGIHALDDAVRRQAGDAAFGPHNACEPAELFSKMTRDPKVYYHPRKYYRFNRVMDGLGQMKKFGEDVDATYPSSGKVFTHEGKVRYAPGARKK